MAYELNYWVMEGASDICILTVRIARLENIEQDKLLEPERRPFHTDVITLDRTDKQSPHYKELWTSVRYKSLDKR